MNRTALAQILTLSACNPYTNNKALLPKIKKHRNVPEYARKKEQGRNELCKCGSGLKYKKCCGR
jgi:uncharacterized protein YecA (UPF0149 family)